MLISPVQDVPSAIKPVGIQFSGTGGERLANALVFGFALRNKEEQKKGRSGGPQKCVLYCFPNEEMASEAAGKCCHFSDLFVHYSDYT